MTNNEQKLMYLAYKNSLMHQIPTNCTYKTYLRSKFPHKDKRSTTKQQAAKKTVNKDFVQESLTVAARKIVSTTAKETVNMDFVQDSLTVAALKKPTMKRKSCTKGRFSYKNPKKT